MTKDPLYIRLLWHGIRASTRDTYNSACRSYEAFCKYHAVAPWPATFETLRTFIANKAFGNKLIPKGGQVKGKTLETYLSALRSAHIDMHFPGDIFADPHLIRLCKGATNIFPRSPSSVKVPVTKVLLRRLLTTQAIAGEHSQDTLNINAAITLAWAGFLRMGEFTWKDKEVLSSARFKRTRPTKSSVTPSASGDHFLFLLKTSKSDKDNKGVSIVIAATGQPDCPVYHMSMLMGWRNKSTRVTSHKDFTPLFALRNGLFSRHRVLRLLTERCRRVGVDPILGHSFRRGAAQEAANNGLSQAEIMLLGRWSSDAVKAYYKSPGDQLLWLQYRFQTGISRPAGPEPSVKRKCY